MAKYAYFDSTATQPAPVLGWYYVLDEIDTDGIDYLNLPASADLLDLTQTEWDNRFSTPLVSNGTLISIPAPTSSQLLDDAKVTQSNIIHDGFNIDSIADVTALTFAWNGGFDSAIKLDAAMRLAQSAGLTTVDFYDKSNVAHTLSIADATTVVQAIAGAYQTVFAKKQSKMISIANATTISEVQSIVW
jgi:hypothetical protein